MLKDSEETFILQCNTEGLSDAQINHNKKQSENLFLLKRALQLQLAHSKDVNAQNGGSVMPDFQNLQDANPVEFLQFMISRKANDTKTYGTKRKANSKAASENKKQKEELPKKSLTQVLRATRKSNLTTPKPIMSKKIIDDDPEIEVIQEKKSTALLPKPGPSTSRASLRPIYPKPSSTRPVLKRVQQANNLLLLNINVKPRNAAHVAVNATQRKELDGKVKVVLIKTASEFVEWLLKQGLIRSQQFCTVHKTVNRQPAKLKLGMFQDPSVLTSSGGYVWVGECCGSKKFVSVYSGSLFGSTPIDNVPPSSILKLIYHWSCQTSISNVETWVKVEKQLISKIYNYLRCVCSIILHDKIYDFGFERTAVELGIVSLGTTTADGSRKAVKVEIMGLYDRKNKSYRLFVSTPEPASSSKERFMRILKPVREVVHRNAIIICDQSVDPSCLNALNFTRVEVCTSSDNENDIRTNSTIMFYLRKHIPKMFQTSLSQLTENQVQLILDELVWREKFASTSAACFDNIMENIAYITFREMENPGVIPLMEYIADYPHNNFRYKSHLNKVIPTIPASIILSPSLKPPAVVPTQHTDIKAVSPMQHSNKVMTKNIHYPQDFLSKETPSHTVFDLEDLTSLADKIMSSPPVTQMANQLSPKTAAATIETATGLIDLESYFYARIEGNSSWGQEQNNCVYKCHICSDTYEENVAFYAHLKFHLEGITAGKEKVDLMCCFCLQHFENVNSLNKHKIDMHLMSDLTQLWCRICAEQFRTETFLKGHMTKKHVEAELPYRCEVCHFATSFYYEIINHFNKSHKGAPYVQCHFCLQVKTINTNGAMSFSTRMYQHLQKHKAQKLNCRSCLLSYYSKYLLNEHRKEHLSCAKVNGVVKYEPPSGYRTLQFRPIGAIPSVGSSPPMTMPSKSQIALSQTLQDFNKVYCDFQNEKCYCIECDAPLHTGNHYKMYRQCSRCVYATCCPNMIMKHAQVFHPSGSSKPLTYFIGSPIPLTNPLFCSCGFSSKSGHHLARHLALCKKTTAFPVLPEGDQEEEPMEVDSDNKNEEEEQEQQEEEEEEDEDHELPDLPLSVEIEEE